MPHITVIPISCIHWNVALQITRYSGQFLGYEIVCILSKSHTYLKWTKHFSCPIYTAIVISALQKLIDFYILL